MNEHHIPFRPQQLRADSNDFNRLLGLRRREIIRWRFTPFGDLAGLEPLRHDEQDFSDVAHACLGTKTQRLIPHVVAYLRDSGWHQSYLRAEFTKTCFAIGGIQVNMGRPLASTHELDWLTTSDLLLVPHISRAGPNGIWHIERGEWHPFILAAGKLRTWTVCESNGQPDFYCSHRDGDLVNSSSIHGINLFTSLSAAQYWIGKCRRDGGSVLSAVALMPRELLLSLARADVVCIDGHDHAVSHRGAVALDCSDTVPSGTLLKALGA